MATMTVPSEEVKLKVSSDGAQAFVDWFYRDINDHKSLAGYYINSNPKYAAANLAADIVINGARLGAPAEYEALLATQRSTPASAAAAAAVPTGPAAQAGGGARAGGGGGLRVRYEVEGWDAHVLNPNFGLACPEPTLARGPDKSGARLSMAVQVTGVLHLGSGAAAHALNFNEAFVLVPNWDAVGPRAARGAKRWLIMSQNYRTL